MHAWQNTFLRTATETFATQGPVIEFGFQAVPGDARAVRQCFPGQEFLGCVLTWNPDDADFSQPVDLPFTSGGAGTVVCLPSPH